MKRIFVMTVVMVGLFIIVSLTIRHSMAVGSPGSTNSVVRTIADGEPPPPPFPPKPPVALVQPLDQKAPWLTADGEPPPPPFPPKPPVALVQPLDQKAPWLTADGEPPPPPFPPKPPVALAQLRQSEHE